MRPMLPRPRAPQGQALSQLLESPFSSIPKFLKGTEGLSFAYFFELPGGASEGVAGTSLTELGASLDSSRRQFVMAPLPSHCMPVTPQQRWPKTIHTPSRGNRVTGPRPHLKSSAEADLSPGPAHSRPQTPTLYGFGSPTPSPPVVTLGPIYSPSQCKE